MTESTRSAVVIRRATGRDLLGVASIEQMSFSDPWTYDALSTVLGLSHARFFVAEEAGGTAARLVGYVVALVMSDDGEIADLAVHPAARRSGVGALLLTRAEEEAARCGVRAMYLEVRASNEAALGLYRSRGFEVVSRRRGYYRLPVEDALVLKHDLAPA